MDESMTIISIISTTLFYKFPFDISKISLINYVNWKDKQEFDRCYSKVLNDESIEVTKHEK